MRAVNAQTTFQALISEVIRNYKDESRMVDIADLPISSKDRESHYRHLEIAPERPGDTQRNAFL